MDRIPESSSSKPEQDHKTILVVEDEQLMLRLLEKVLSKRGYRVLAASDGEQAIEVYRGYQPRIDMVLLDIGLPKLAGREVFLKMREANADVRVVIASGYLEPKMKNEMALAGVKGFLNKPYILAEVVETIRSVIEKR